MYILQIRNVGVVKMPHSTLTIHWPLQLRDENSEFVDFVLYLVKEPEVSYSHC